MVFVYKKLAQFAVRCALPPRRSESPVWATDNKPSCVLHLLGWFIGSRGFSSLERRPEFRVLQKKKKIFRTFDYNITRKELIGKNLFICFYINPLSCMFYHSSPLFQTLSHVSDWQVNILKQKWKSKVCLLVEFCMDHLLVS